MALLADAAFRDQFYAPQASVSLISYEQEIMRFHGLTVTQVEIDFSLSAAATFKFTIPNTFVIASNGLDDFKTDGGKPVFDLLYLGARVWISLGYGDNAHQILMVSGYVTGVSTNFAEGASPDIEVTGHDALYPLTLGKEDLKVEKAAISEMVARIATTNNLQLQFEGDSKKESNLDANQESQLAFLKKLADTGVDKQEKWEFFVRSNALVDTLHFKPRATDSPPVETLKWGENLLSFKPELNLGDQVSKVEVHGIDELTGKPIVGEAEADSFAGKFDSPGKVMHNFANKKTVFKLRLPVKTKQEADARAASILKSKMQQYLKGEGETFGSTALLPDTMIRITGLGQKFSRDYYVVKTVHRYDSSGYRTRFSIEEPNDKASAA
jgi:uncharacterized protein